MLRPESGVDLHAIDDGRGLLMPILNKFDKTKSAQQEYKDVIFLVA